jgi:hypothetical protein
MSHRMSPDDFDALLQLIHPAIEVDQKSARRATPNGGLIPLQRLALTIQFLGGGKVQQLVDIFGVGVSTFYEIIWSTLRAINACKELAPVWDISPEVCMSDQHLLTHQ